MQLFYLWFYGFNCHGDDFHYETVQRMKEAISFWLENIFFVLTVKEIVIQFLSGILLPLSFFSNNFRLFLDVLPFKYLVYEPLQMFSNDTYKLIDYLRIICIQLIWCIIFYIISRFILRKGVEHFSNVGG